MAWKRFKRNKLAMSGLVVIAISVFIFIAGYLITPDSTPDSNDQKPELQIKPPGFSVRMLKIRKNEEPHQVNWFIKMMFGQQSDYSYITLYDYTFSGNDIVVEEYTGNEPNRGTKMRYNLADVVYDINGNMPVKNDEANGPIEFYQYTTSKKIKVNSKEMQAEIEKNLLINKKYLLGTDRLGRDLLSRMLIGT